MADDFFRDVVAKYSPERQRKIEERAKQLQVENQLALEVEAIAKKYITSLLESARPVRSKPSKSRQIVVQRSQGLVNLKAFTRRPKHLANGQISNIS